MIKNPIDLDVIEKNMLNGKYVDVNAFDEDFFLLFRNVQVSCELK